MLRTIKCQNMMFLGKRSSAAVQQAHELNNFAVNNSHSFNGKNIPYSGSSSLFKFILTIFLTSVTCPGITLILRFVMRDEEIHICGKYLQYELM